MRQSANANSVLVFIPSYNDNATAIQLSQHVMSLGAEFRALILDDGSDTPLDSKILPSGVLCFRAPTNVGIGIGTHIAVDHALQHGYRFFVRLDGDGQHPVKEIPSIVARLIAGDADIVAASRVNRDDSAGRDEVIRRLVRAYYAAIVKLITRGRSPADVNSGFFGLNRKAMIAVAALDLERYPEPQMYISMVSSGFQIAIHEIRQSERLVGSSTLNVWQAAKMLYRFHIVLLEHLMMWRKK